MSWELRKIRKDGEVLWVRETARAMLIKKQPVILIVCEDITEGKRAAESIARGADGAGAREPRRHHGPAHGLDRP